MTTNLSMYLNLEQSLAFCAKYKCMESDMNKVLKATCTDDKNSKFYREMGVVEEKVENDHDKIIDDYLRMARPAAIDTRRSEIKSRAIYTPDIPE